MADTANATLPDDVLERIASVAGLIADRTITREQLSGGASDAVAAHGLHIPEANRAALDQALADLVASHERAETEALEAVAAASADPTQTTTVTLPCFVCFAVGTVAVAAVEALIVSAVASALLAAVSALTAATEGAAAPLEAALIAVLTNSFTVDASATIIGVTAPLIATEACRGFFHCFT